MVKCNEGFKRQLRCPRRKKEYGQEGLQNRNAQAPCPEGGCKRLLLAGRRHEFVRTGLELGLRISVLVQLQSLDALLVVVLAAVTLMSTVDLDLEVEVKALTTPTVAANDCLEGSIEPSSKDIFLSLICCFNNSGLNKSAAPLEESVVL